MKRAILHMTESWQQQCYLDDLNTSSCKAEVVVNREGESSQEGEHGAELEDLTETCSFTSLFILVVLRWIERGSKLANIRGFNDRARSSHDSRRLEEPDSSSWFLFHSQINDQTMTDYSDLKRFDIMCFEWTTPEANIYVLELDSVEDLGFCVCWRISFLLDLFIFPLPYDRICFPRFFLMMMFEVLYDN